MNSIFFQQEALSFIPITEYQSNFDSNASLDHGFGDFPFFPTWSEFLSNFSKKQAIKQR